MIENNKYNNPSININAIGKKISHNQNELFIFCSFKKLFLNPLESSFLLFLMKFCLV